MNSKNPEVSIVMTTHRRAGQLGRTLDSIFRQRFNDFEVIIVEDGNSDENATRDVALAYPVRFYRREKRPEQYWSNPSTPNNIGLRRATGNIIVLQNAENEHIGNSTGEYPSGEVIEPLIEPVRRNRMVSTFASVMALNPNGSEREWYVHSRHNPRPLFFCQAIAREHVERLRGFDEDFKFYGWEDNDFADRLAVIGVSFEFHDEIRVNHQWHEPGKCFGMEHSIKIYNEKKAAMARGEIGPERNIGREWGQLES